jgi:hypothetical protein
MRDQIWQRSEWLRHLHGCRECEGRQPCRVGLDLIGVMAGGMSAEESLPEWMTQAGAGSALASQASIRS